MHIADVIAELEKLAPLAYQESYDNAGLIVGSPGWTCTGIVCALDSIEEVIDEAIAAKVNLVVAHHPIIFRGLKSITGKNYVERAIIKAIKNDIALYAIHTNLDNVIIGVSGEMAKRLDLKDIRILQPSSGNLVKLTVYVPIDHLDRVRQALFSAGGGEIGNYSECSFSGQGLGTFKGNEFTNPFVGSPGERHEETEAKLEILFPTHLQQQILTALKLAHPYEEVAHDLVKIENQHQGLGAGIIGNLQDPMEITFFLERLKTIFGLSHIKHTRFVKQTVQRIALCGGTGSFLLNKALQQKADVFISADFKYHEFFDADNKILICDIGHYESEQFTIQLLHDILVQKFPTFAVLKTKVKTNPVFYR